MLSVRVLGVVWLLVGALAAAALGCGPSGTRHRGVGFTPIAPDVPDGGADARGAPAVDAIGDVAGAPGGLPAIDAAPDRGAEGGPLLPDASIVSPDVSAPPADGPPAPIDTAQTPPDAAPLPPDVGQDAAPPPPFLTLTRAPARPHTDLSALGTIDWVHWGFGQPYAVNQKHAGPQSIRMRVLLGQPLSNYDDRPVAFSWSDGSPVLRAEATRFGVDVGDEVGRGFEMEVPGDPARPLRLTLFLGVWGARGRFEARLTNASSTPIMDSSLMAGHPGQDAIYELSFQPQRVDQVLVVRWVVESVGLEFGNVSLQAATLAE